jgi:hypothetical protein
MHKLHLNAAWLSDITALRDAVTEDTHLIRFDNGFYRVCQPGPDFSVEVFPGLGRVDESVQIKFRRDNLYATEVAGHKVGRYPSTLDLLLRDARGLDDALHQLARPGEVKNRETLALLLVFCVAESLRFDRIATQVDQVIKSTAGRLLGTPTQLDIGPLYTLFKNWERASAAVLRGTSAQGRQIVARPRALLTAEERRHSERVQLLPGDLALSDTVRALKVIKLPG